MHSDKPLKTFLFPAVNLLLAVFLLAVFFIAGENIVRTFPVARMNALGTLKPHQMDYIWELNFQQAPLNTSWVRFYADFYEQLLKVYPSLRETYGMLGYCYHYLGNDAKAIDYLQKGIAYDPLYSWNYYNLAVIYIAQSRYSEASAILQKLQDIPPQKSLQRMYSSQYIYLPLLSAGGKGAVRDTVEHLKMSYKVSFDLVQLISQMAYNPSMGEAIKKMKLQVYAF